MLTVLARIVSLEDLRFLPGRFFDGGIMTKIEKGTLLPPDQALVSGVVLNRRGAERGAAAKPVLDYNDPDFVGLRHLVDVELPDAQRIAAAAIERPEEIQLVDFIDQIGLPEETKVAIRQKQAKVVPERRKIFIEKLQQVVEVTPSMEYRLSLARINPFTRFEDAPPLLFGMGGGSKTLNRGFPMDILNMVLTAEKLRRELGLGRCRIICANGITYTNIPRDSVFSQEGIDRVLGAERDLLQLVVERFGIADHWDIFLETDIEQIIGGELKEEYDRMIEDADTVSYIGGHHYAIEMAQMYSLLNQETGGVKLGWFMRHLEKKKGGYIMDEQPFDARYVMYLADRGLANTISIPYVHAGVRLEPGFYSGKEGREDFALVNKAAPYICYEPDDRVLLRPSEDPTKKLSEAYKVGGGLGLKGVRRHFGSMIKLFEEIVINRREVLPTRGVQEPIERRVRIDDLLEVELEEHRTHRIGQRLQFILDFIFEGSKQEAERIYKNGFSHVGN